MKTENDSEFNFLKALSFEKGHLSEAGIRLVKEEAHKNQFYGYFDWRKWRNPEYLKILISDEIIVLLEYILEEYLYYLSENTTLNAYRLLLAYKMENNECRSGLDILYKQ